MKGVVFLGDRKLQFVEFPDPTPGPHEVVLEIKASGMCVSDLIFYRASTDGDGGARSLGLGGDGSPVIAGHEPCGVVAARGSAVPEALAPVGARVMCHHYSGCGVDEEWTKLMSSTKQAPTVYSVSACFYWSRLPDSNRGPPDYKSPAPDSQP